MPDPFASQQLRVVAQLQRGEQKLSLTQPTSVAHDFTALGARHQTAQVRGERFQNRFRSDLVCTPSCYHYP